MNVPAPDPHAAALQPIHILLVEDNPADVRLTREALREGRLCNRLAVASDGEEALDYLYRRGAHAQAPRPDLVLLDLNLPRLDGCEVLDVMKADPDLRRIPVVVLTTSSSERDVRAAYDLHANCYITKPVDLDRFLTVVRGIDDFWLTIVRLPESRAGERGRSPACRTDPDTPAGRRPIDAGGGGSDADRGGDLLPPHHEVKP